jgi:hypothetical protein
MNEDDSGTSSGWRLWPARRNRKGEVHFTVAVRNDNRQPRPRRLKCVLGPGDDGEAVITILLPEED